MNISVIIPTYNRAHTLPRALDSVLKQTSPVTEIIVIDDGSTDSTETLIKKRYPQVQYYYQSQSGVSSARNTGISRSTGDWIALLDSDDSWLPQKIERIKDAVHQDLNCQLVHSDEIWIRNGTRVNAMKKHQKRGGNIFEYCLPLCVISPSAAVIEKKLLESAGMFDESLTVCEDYDLWLKICSKIPVTYIDECLITKYGGHDDQLSRQLWGMDRYRIRSINQLLQRYPLTQQQKSQAYEMLIIKLDILLKGAKKHNNTSVLEEFGPLLHQWKQQQNQTLSRKAC